MSSWNILAANLDMCQGVCKCCCCLCTSDEDLSMLFCSELAAETYMSVGLLDPQLRSSEFVPAFFGSTRRLALQPPGAALSPEQLLVGPIGLEDRNQLGYQANTLQDPTKRWDSSHVEFGSGGYWGVDTMQQMSDISVDQTCESTTLRPPTSSAGELSPLIQDK